MTIIGLFLVFISRFVDSRRMFFVYNYYHYYSREQMTQPHERFVIDYIKSNVGIFSLR